ncbi:MAG TPA: glycosyl transferase family 1 [Anaerolineaceae bacterium]|nr:glycosyl transferase family 1 [Anaerolineaceae bacterium]
MKIAFLSTRIHGLDGVSLEIRKWASILVELGHELYYCAGELGDQPNALLIPEMHFTHPLVEQVQQLAFGQVERDAQLNDLIQQLVQRLSAQIGFFLSENRIDVIIPENILTIPMNIPLGIALSNLIREGNIPTVAHHHDFYWERERFSQNCIPDLLDRYFPPDLPSMHHVVINSLAQEQLQKKKGVRAEIIPNVFDFTHPVSVPSISTSDLRRELGIQPGEIMVLQPTRIIPRKGIELAIDLVAALRQPAKRAALGGRDTKLVISHPSGDEGGEYLAMLLQKAKELDIALILADQLLAPAGRDASLTLWDAYRCADLVTYPSSMEGFGNALLEALYFRKPVVINRYPVYERDIQPLGLDLIEMSGSVNAEVVEQVIAVLNDTQRREKMGDLNFSIAKEHFSYEAIEPKLDKMMGLFALHREK